MSSPKILIPVDGSETSERTLETVLVHRNRFPGHLTLLHVIDMDRLTWRMIPDFQLDMVREQARQAGERLLAEQAERLARAGLEVERRLEVGSPRTVITRIANEEDFQLLVIGRHLQGEIRDVLFGSVANYVLHHVRCPVLLI